MIRAVDIIRKKRDGAALTADEIEIFVAGATTGAWPPYQTAALLMAVVLARRCRDRQALRSHGFFGVRLDLSNLPGTKVDKHSTGGVGDKTSLILAPLAAPAGPSCR